MTPVCEFLLKSTCVPALCLCASFFEHLCACIVPVCEFLTAPVCLHCACVLFSYSTCVPAVCLCASFLEHLWACTVPVCEFGAHRVWARGAALQSLPGPQSCCTRHAPTSTEQVAFQLTCVNFDNFFDKKRFAHWQQWLWHKKSLIKVTMWKQSSSAQMSCEVYRVIISRCWQTKDEYFPHHQLSER